MYKKKRESEKEQVVFKRCMKAQRTNFKKKKPLLSEDKKKRASRRKKKNLLSKTESNDASMRTEFRGKKTF